MNIDKTSPEYKAGFVDGESKGNGSAKHYMNYILCKSVCQVLTGFRAAAPRLFKEKYNQFREKGNKLAEQLGDTSIPTHDSDDVTEEYFRQIGMITNIKDNFFSK